MSNISLKLSDEKIDKIKETFKEYIKPSNNEYIDTFIQKDDLTISIYKSKKVLFQGNDAIFYGSAFLDTKFSKQCGSDEVGTGDYFGPIIVCACLLEEKDKSLLDSLNVRDSKELSDERIIKIGEKLIQHVKHSLLILDNEKYNEVHKSNNLNMIKAKMHNQAYLNLIKKGYDLPKVSYIDDFCGERNYYQYLKDEKEVYHNLIFETKAENTYEAVACASIIARYAFIKKMEELSSKYGLFFHKGANEDVNEDAKAFVKKYGINNLNKVAKLHFKNTELINH